MTGNSVCRLKGDNKNRGNPSMKRPETPGMDFRLYTAIVCTMKFQLLFERRLSFRIKNSSKCLNFWL